jgi:hypothetical protein
MLNKFPALDAQVIHRSRDYYIALFTFFSVAICLTADADASIEKQNALGVCAWVFLICVLFGEDRSVKIQVMIAVMFATIGEHFASPYMGGYTYRFENVPAYVPPGHGLVYLTAVALGRSGFFHAYAREITLFVLVTCGLWSLWGITFAQRGDAVGAFLFLIYAVVLFRGRSPLLYLAAFFITTWLELIGTAVGTWHWAVIDPVLQLPQGNPPSGVAAWYCLVDAVAIGGAPKVLKVVNSVSARLKKYKLLQNSTTLE